MRERALIAGGLNVAHANPQTLAGSAILAGRAKERSAETSPAPVEQLFVTGFGKTGCKAVNDMSCLAGEIGAVVGGTWNFQFPRLVIL